MEFNSGFKGLNKLYDTSTSQTCQQLTAVYLWAQSIGQNTKQLRSDAEIGTDCTAFYALDILPAVGFTTATVASAEITNKMQPCNRIYYSNVYWRLNTFRAAHRSSSGAINCICSLWFTYTCVDRPVTTCVCKPEDANSLELLMMSGVPLEKCWAFNKRWNNKFYYKVASCWLFLLIHTTMHGSMNIKFRNCSIYRQGDINRMPNTVGLRHNLVPQLSLHPDYGAMCVLGAINDTENYVNILTYLLHGAESFLRN